MIYQIGSVKTKTEALPKAHPHQSRCKGLETQTVSRVPVWSPITPGPFMVPVTRWVE